MKTQPHQRSSLLLCGCYVALSLSVCSTRHRRTLSTWKNIGCSGWTNLSRGSERFRRKRAHFFWSLLKFHCMSVHSLAFFCPEARRTSTVCLCPLTHCSSFLLESSPSFRTTSQRYILWTVIKKDIRDHYYHHVVSVIDGSYIPFQIPKSYYTIMS